MENLFRKLTQKNHILDSYAQVAEKYVLPEGDSYRKFNPGIDGRDLKEFEKDLEANLEDCRRFLLEGDRDFLPQILRQVPKSDPGKFREIYLQSLRDKILQKAMAEAIWPALEKRLSPNLFSYRLSPVYGQGAAVKRLKKFLEENANRGFVFKTDISDFTEHIRHDIL
ncbi:MAG: hypothetical protein K8R69_00090, partial [Deltaproteobacteria bacterium]|nr:hypothetical protein [Deltaproteobacteria bacterium]